MNENTDASNTPRVSRLDMVRNGLDEAGTPRVPKRGRALVDIDNIVPDPQNERKVFRRISELAATIKTVGIIDLPTVVPLDDGRYKITTGERRWRAAKEAGLKQIPVIIEDSEQESRRRTKSLISNIQREDLTALELARGLQDLKKGNPDLKTNRDLAKLIGKSEQWVGQMLRVLDLAESAQKALQTAEGRKIANDSVVEIARVEDPNIQRELLDSALSGATARDIRVQARNAKNTRTAKPIGRSIQKIQVANGMVVVRCRKQKAGKRDFIQALSEALKAIRQRGITKTTDVGSSRR